MGHGKKAYQKISLDDINHKSSLARPEGVEPSTFGSEVQRSVQLSYGRALSWLHNTISVKERHSVF